MISVFLGFSDLSLLLVRVVLAIIFADSGLKHLKNPDERAESIGMGKGFVIFLGAAECAGALGLFTGVLASYAAFGLMLIMLGAMYKKMFVWKTGFWGDGWHYDLIFFTMNSIILTTGAGKYVLF